MEHIIIRYYSSFCCNHSMSISIIISIQCLNLSLNLLTLLNTFNLFLLLFLPLLWNNNFSTVNPSLFLSDGSWTQIFYGILPLFAKYIATVYYLLSFMYLSCSHSTGGTIPLYASNIATVYPSLFYKLGLWYH